MEHVVAAHKVTTATEKMPLTVAGGDNNATRTDRGHN